MKTSTLGLGVIAAVALSTLVLSTPTYAQQAASDTDRPQIEGSREGRDHGMRKGKKGHMKGNMKTMEQFFENLSDEQRDAMKEELTSLKDSINKDDVQAMSEEEREGFHLEMQAQRKEIMEKYVDAEDLEDGSFEAFEADQEAKHAQMKASGEKKGEKGQRGEREDNQGKKGEAMKGGSMEKFVGYIATMDEEKKTELLEKIDTKVASLTTRIQESDRSEDEKVTALERMNTMLDTIRELLS